MQPSRWGAPTSHGFHCDPTRSIRCIWLEGKRRRHIIFVVAIPPQAKARAMSTGIASASHSYIDAAKASAPSAMSFLFIPREVDCIAKRDSFNHNSSDPLNRTARSSSSIC